MRPPGALWASCFRRAEIRQNEPTGFDGKGVIMGQTDSQFKAFIRLMLDDVKDVKREQDEKKKDEKLDKIIDNLQKTLED